MKERTRVVIMGAAGRDFHNFNVAFRDDLAYDVVAFTAAQIPDIAGRTYPPELAGHLYPRGIPIHPESDLERLIEDLGVEQVVFSYSDVAHVDLMHKASRVVARGADFRLLGTRATMLPSRVPVVSVCAVRTGCGKSAVSRRIARILKDAGLRVAVVRHPMPYGDLAKQAVQRFASLDDLARAACTIEEREEYEPHLAAGSVVFAGVDYARILHAAEDEADVIVWDGGNNDTSFFLPDLEIVLADPHRHGHETTYFPGEVNLHRAHVVVIAKTDTAAPEHVASLRLAIQANNPGARILEAAMPVRVDRKELVRGRHVLVVEDGPTITHGGMRAGAGLVAAEHLGATPVDPRPFAVGSIEATFDAWKHVGPVLPAMGYGARQLRDLEETIARTPCDAVLVATPIDLARVVRIEKPVARASYELEEQTPGLLADSLAPVIAEARHARAAAAAGV